MPRFSGTSSPAHPLPKSVRRQESFAARAGPRTGEPPAKPAQARLGQATRRTSGWWRRLRLSWLEGRLAAAFGRREEAIAALRGVRDGFADRKIAYDTALASLELAVLYLEEGRTSEVKDLAGKMVWIFQAQGGR